MIEIKREVFGCSKEGYLKEVQLLVKVFPQVIEKIVFVGFLQRVDKFDDMEPPKSEYENAPQHFIYTDAEGNITNVTEGLYNELGLHAKFFSHGDSIFEQMFNIGRISPDLMDFDL